MPSTMACTPTTPRLIFKPTFKSCSFKYSDIDAALGQILKS